MAVRLRHADCSSPGITRVRRGRGFSYRGSDGRRVTDSETLDRIQSLAIPPAWQDVWICADDRGHLQATGTDVAGRKQYLYHPVWRERADRRKFHDMEAFARRLPRLRRHVGEALRADDKLSKERVAAGAVRLLDIGLFRVGGEESADEFGHYGLATLTARHLEFRNGEAVFDYPAKSGVRRLLAVSDPESVALLRRLRARRSGPEELLAFRKGGCWHRLGSDGVNDYIKAHTGDKFSAKDFRTWNATVLAAVLLAALPRQRPNRRRAIRKVVGEVADLLGNTPAVARDSYIDPRVFDRYLGGKTVDHLFGRDDSLQELSDRHRRRLELAVLDLIH
jgi:DNA topoisomerase-1